MADPHIGKNNVAGHPVSAERWSAPMREVADYLSRNVAEVVVVAGDLGHDRRPTTENGKRMFDTIQAFAEHTSVVVVDGNHDAFPNGVPTTWPIARGEDSYGYGEVDVVSGGVTLMDQYEDVNMIVVPYPFMPRGGGTIDERLKAAKELTLAQIEHARSKADPDRPLMLVGHLMVSRGGTAMQGEPMMLGRDVVFPLEELREIMHPWPIVLGHVHQHDDVYVGSTQPTDFADTGQKGFDVIRFQRIEGLWDWTKEFVPYKTSVTVGSFAPIYDGQFPPIGDAPAEPRTDMGRVRVSVPAGVDPPTEAQVREEYGPYFKQLVEVDIRKERVRVARMDIADDEIAGLSVQDCCDAWLGQSDYPDDVKEKAMSALDRVFARAEEVLDEA